MSQLNNLPKRSNEWLEDLMYEIIEDHFNDIPVKNLILIKFGRASKRQLGSIKWVTPKTRVKSLMKKKRIKDFHRNQDDKRISLITITKKFQNSEIPEFVVKSTIAHELCHYAHGFSSPIKQQYKYPHQGGIIRKELRRRDLEDINLKAKKWLRENWAEYT